MSFITEELGGTIGATYAEPQGRIRILPEKVATNFPSTDNADIAKYGNVYTSLDGADLFASGYTWGDVVTVTFLDKTMDLPIVPTFSYVDQGTAGVFVNKNGDTGEPTGRVFLAINMGDFATTNGLATKTTNADKTYFWTACEGVEFPVPVTITMKEAGGYATEMEIRDINRTNNRADYPTLSDAEFANFREVTTTGMGAKTLYRGSSPINPEIGRNTYADAALEAAGATVIMNLADDQATAEAYAGFADTYYSGQNIIYLNLGVDFAAADFQAGLANGLRFFAANPGVYYVHCAEGKDRAGFVSALLECLMGATYEEVVNDYLTTYRNYYTVVDGVQQPLSDETLAAIANSNIIKTLQSAFGVADLASADLAAEAVEYLKEIGLNDEEIAALKKNLGGAPAPDYVLFGWIGGANYACEENANVPSEYVFVDGKLTATFTEDAYVAVKLSDNSAWYMTNGWLGTEVTSATLYNTAVTGENSNKLYVPGGVEVEFTLVDNGDDTLTLSYATAAPEGFLVVEPAKSNNTTRFGHIDLDIPVADFLELYALGDVVTVTVNGFTFDAPVVTNYDDVDTGEYLIRCASGKTVTTLAINYGQIGVAAGIVEKYTDPETGNVTYVAKEGVVFPMYATIELKEAGGYADELAIRKLNRTNDRANYPGLTDAEFANFRAVATTGMGANVLFRSSSPISDEIGRNTYADAAAEAAGVKTFVNLADTQAEAEAFTGYGDTYYSTQTILFLGLPVAFTTDEFKTGLAEGYRFIITNEGPYLIHCLEGKDRTGLAIGVLEALMGASLEEIQADYLKTYENYFDVKDGVQVALTDAQKDVLKGIITKNLGIIFDADLATADLAAEAEAYLKEIGLSDDEITALKARLSGTPAPAPDYVLFGWIGGANYACEENANVPSEYVFVDGKLTATFTEDAYVAVKLSDNSAWYMTNGWLGTEVTSATLYNTAVTGENSNKLYVPGGVEVEFTLVDNGDDTLTLSYAPKAAPATEYVYYHGLALADGDEVVLVNRNYSMAISNADLNETTATYRAGVAVTPVDGILEDPDAAIIWTVTAVEGGFELADAEGHKLSIPSGKNQLVLDGDDTVWTVPASEKTEGAVYIASATSVGTSGDHRAIEWYARYTEFSTYYLNASSDETLFAFDLYVKTDKSTIHEHVWVAGTVDAADCTHQEITHYTCSVCGTEKTEVTGEALGHNWGAWVVDPAATCTAAGSQTHTCERCAATETEAIPATGHKDEDGDGKCDNCGEAMGELPGNEFTLFTGELVEGDYLIVYSGKALRASNTANANRLDYAEITEGDSITCDDVTIIVHIAKSGDYWTIYNADAGKYVGGTGTKNQAKMIDAGTDYSLWTVTMTDGKYEFVNKGNSDKGVNCNLRNNGTYGWACYSTSTGGAVTLYKLG